MKSINSILGISLLAVMVAGCGGRSNQLAVSSIKEPMQQDSMNNDDFITIDVTKSSSTRRTMILQDFIDRKSTRLNSSH